MVKCCSMWIKAHLQRQAEHQVLYACWSDGAGMQGAHGSCGTALQGWNEHQPQHVLEGADTPG